MVELPLVDVVSVFSSFKLGYAYEEVQGPIRAAAGIAGYANGDGVVVENC